MRILIAAEGDAELCSLPCTWRAQQLASAFRPLGLEVFEAAGEADAPIAFSAAGHRLVSRALCRDFDRGGLALTTLHQIRRRLRHLLRRERIELVHVFGGLRWAVTVWFAARQNAIPIVWDVDPRTREPTSVEKPWVRQFDQIVTVDDSQRRRWLAAGCDGARVRVAPWGVRPAPELRPLQADRLVVAGALGPEPGLEALGRALAKLPQDQRPSVSVVSGAQAEAVRRGARAQVRIDRRQPGMWPFVKALGPHPFFTSVPPDPARAPEPMEAAAAGAVQIPAAFDLRDPDRLAQSILHTCRDDEANRSRRRASRAPLSSWDVVSESYFEVYDDAVRAWGRRTGWVARLSRRWDRLAHAHFTRKRA